MVKHWGQDIIRNTEHLFSNPNQTKMREDPFEPQHPRHTTSNRSSFSSGESMAE